MPQQKLTIVPVTLHPDSKNSLLSDSLKNPSPSIGTIKTANTEISFYDSVDEQVGKSIKYDFTNIKNH